MVFFNFIVQNKGDSVVVMHLASALAIPLGLLLWSEPVAANPSAGLELTADRYRSILGPAPQSHGKIEHDDLVILRWNQRTRYPQAVVHSWKFLNRYVGTFDTAVGGNIAKSAPILSKGLMSFLKIVDNIKNELKEDYQRPRPFMSHSDIKPCLPLQSSFSFPSGHSTWYASTALLLADLMPERRGRLTQVGRQGGYARVYCGMHYPSDVLAGERFAKAITADIIASPQWQSFRNQVKPEVVKLLQSPPAGLPLLSN